MAFAANDHPAVSYYDIFAADLKYASFDGTQWTSIRLASKGAVGLYTNLSFDNAGSPRINLNGNDLAQLQMDLSGVVGEELTTFILGYRLFGSGNQAFDFGKGLTEVCF